MNDLYPEHCVVVSLALTACKQLIDQGHALKLYTWEMGSVGRIIRFCPDIIIDITASFAEKVAAIKPFISQVPDHDQQLHLRYITASARYWGDKIGVHYAEPFFEMLIHGDCAGFDLSDADFDYNSRYLPEARTAF